MADRDPGLVERRNYPDYLEDYGAWLAAQIMLLRERRFEEIDLENLLEEVEGLARSDFKALISAIRVVLIHMLKWDIQTDYQTRSWSDSIQEHRRRVSQELKDSLSYSTRLEDAVARAYRRARFDAARQTKLPLASFPETCPFTFDDIMQREHHLRDHPRDHL